MADKMLHLEKIFFLLLNLRLEINTETSRILTKELEQYILSEGVDINVYKKKIRDGLYPQYNTLNI
jgi:hypothetical protein